MNPVLETSRLSLRQLTIKDAPFIIELVNSPGWLQFIGDRNIHDIDQAKDYLLNGPMKSYALHGYGLYLVATKIGNAPIGLCGILKRDSLDTPDIGFAFLPGYMGKGYAYEIASATIAHAKETLKIPLLSAITDPENSSSIRLLERLGMKFCKMVQTGSGTKELMLFQKDLTATSNNVTYLIAETPATFKDGGLLFHQYADSIGIDLSFQNFETELETMSFEYYKPRGALLIGYHQSSPVACVGLRRFEDGIGELKRMFVAPNHQGQGVGKEMLSRILAIAKDLGYQRLRLDSLDTMTAARKVYTSAGFKEIPPYRFNPLAGAVYMELQLGR